MLQPGPGIAVGEEAKAVEVAVVPSVILEPPSGSRGGGRVVLVQSPTGTEQQYNATTYRD